MVAGPHVSEEEHLRPTQLPVWKGRGSKYSVAFLLCLCILTQCLPPSVRFDGRSLGGSLWYKIGMNCHSRYLGRNEFKSKSCPSKSVLPLATSKTHIAFGDARAPSTQAGQGFACLTHHCLPNHDPVHVTIRYTVNVLDEGTCHTVFLTLYLLVPTAAWDLLSFRTLFHTRSPRQRTKGVFSSTFLPLDTTFLL